MLPTNGDDLSEVLTTRDFGESNIEERGEIKEEDADEEMEDGGESLLRVYKPDKSRGGAREPRRGG